MNLDTLNDMQRAAVLQTEGPLLILAGAGSGKTRVLTHRVAYLIEKGVSPFHIMAITFTNKAAAELKQRIESMTPAGGQGVWAATFHSTCVRILRRFAEEIGYERSFTIYDTDDCKSLMKAICKDMNIDTKQVKEKALLNAISSAKNELVSAEEYVNSAGFDYNKQRIGSVYREYQRRLKSNNAFDFDDLIMKTVELLRFNTEARLYYQEKFHYIMVDEYQDTNTAQFELVRLLAGGRENLCVVGDDDQSIYKFRGANIYNILNFEQHYPNARVIKLEQNYRSTGNILTAANAVIKNNQGRKEKSLWTSEEDGEKIRFKQFDSAYEEASYVASDIIKNVRNGSRSYNDFAVLYRTNAQSRLIEEKMIYEGIHYKIVGGVNFYSRKEVKDLIAYLKTIDNGRDDVAVERIINVPKRGIGTTSIAKVSDYAKENDINLYEALIKSENVPGIGAAAKKIKGFTDLIESLKPKPDQPYYISDILEKILEETGYVQELEAEGTDEAKARIENIDELMSKCVIYQQEAEEPTLSGFLEEVALVADIDSLDESEDYVVLMTLHGAKGLEFPKVYMVGMEDGLFPSYNSIMDGDGADSELEEERRLCYVGITRAKEELVMTCAKMRMIRGETQFSSISRFVKEIPENLIQGNMYERKSKEDSISYSIPDAEPVSRNFATRRPAAAVMKNMGSKIEKVDLDYVVGDYVTHIKFGKGLVKEIVDGGKDYEVTVDFEGFGVKKMIASFAKLKKV